MESSCSPIVTQCGTWGRLTPVIVVGAVGVEVEVESEEGWEPGLGSIGGKIPLPGRRDMFKNGRS